MEPRCNGFRVRGLNQDCDHLAVQSSAQTTWLLGRSRGGFGKAQWREIAIGRDELMVMRAYGHCSPTIEIQPLGDKAGILILQLSRGPTCGLRVGSKRVFELGPDESLVIRCEWMQYPRSSGLAPGAYGAGLQV